MRAIKNLAKAAIDPYRPLLAAIVITQRCNLSCGYCFEYDKVSKPIALDILKSRIDDLKRLKVVFVTLNGGEPLMHPNIVELVRYIRECGMTPLMNSNGFLLKPALIEDLNDAGLFGIQISCDGMKDTEVSKKTMQHLRRKFDFLQQFAKFQVRVNTVLGGCPPDEAVDVARIVNEYGFDSQCSLLRNADGSAQNLTEDMQKAYKKIRALRGRLPIIFHDKFQVALAEGKEIDWKCRSGARYFHIDQEGLVHPCQPRYDANSKALAEYTRKDIKQCFHQHKACSKRCPHAYAHIGSRMDGFRHQEKVES